MECGTGAFAYRNETRHGSEVVIVDLDAPADHVEGPAFKLKRWQAQIFLTTLAGLLEVTGNEAVLT